MNRRNVELVYAHNDRRDYPLVDNKILCKEKLISHGVPVPGTLAICPGLFAVPRVLRELKGRGQFVVKPASGSGGDGILVVGEQADTGWLSASGRAISEEALRQHIANVVFGAFSKDLEDQALVEERIIQHSFFDALYESGVSDIRLIVLKGHCLMGMVRVPTDESDGKANLHQGGIGIGIDLQTGFTTLAQSKGQAISKHPDSGASLLHQVLPFWKETFETGLQAAESVPLDYVGVDIVVDAQAGPMVLELNARPGLEIQNVNHQALGPLAAEFLS